MDNSRNIVICCDGTGNEISENISNVLKLYRCLRKTEKTEPRQMVFYDPGVGTLARPDPWHKLKQDFPPSWGSPPAMGSMTMCCGLWFLVENWREGDRIYLFGFSRGAYTVRVLAGLIHKMGLITPNRPISRVGPDRLQAVLLRRGAKLRENSGGSPTPAPPRRPSRPRRTTTPRSSRASPRRAGRTIRFVGVWDTVASVIVPRADRLYLAEPGRAGLDAAEPERADLPAGDLDRRAALHVPPEEVGRAADLQARALQRRRRPPQDILQVWFAGVHSDIGGGYPEKRIRAVEISAAVDDRRGRQGRAQIQPANVNQLAWGIPRKNSPYSYVAPNPEAMLHNSLHGAWWLLEFIPKLAKYKEWPARQTYFGLYIPDAEPRPIPEGAFVHESVVKRMEKVREYRPVNLPAKYETWPMPVKPGRGVRRRAS